MDPFTLQIPNRHFAASIIKITFLVILNGILLLIILLSDANYLDDLKKEMHQGNIVLSKDSTFEPGKEIVWTIPANEKEGMKDILELELSSPSASDTGESNFQLHVDGYVEFDDGRELQRIFVPSTLGQNKSGFTHGYVDPGKSNSKSSLDTKFGGDDHYTIGQFVNLFWEPLTIKISIADVSNELVGKPFHMALTSKYYNHEIGLLYSITQIVSYLKISAAVISLFLLNFIYLKNSSNKSPSLSGGTSNKNQWFGSLARAIATTINAILIAQPAWIAARSYVLQGKSPDYGLEGLVLSLYSLSNIIALLTPVTRTGIFQIIRRLVLGLNIVLVFAALLFAITSILESAFSGLEMIVTIALLLAPAATTWGLLAQTRFKVTIYGMSLW